MKCEERTERAKGEGREESERRRKKRKEKGEKPFQYFSRLENAEQKTKLANEKRHSGPFKTDFFF